jgi:hypothetical protein
MCVRMYLCACYVQCWSGVVFSCASVSSILLLLHVSFTFFVPASRYRAQRYVQAMVGLRCSFMWAGNKWYSGTITKFDEATKLHHGAC